MVSASGDGLVRINIRLSDRKTSVSMDAELYEALVERHGGERAPVGSPDAHADDGDTAFGFVCVDAVATLAGQNDLAAQGLHVVDLGRWPWPQAGRSP